jgi:hypothetical protein
MAFTDAEKTDIRRYCGFGAYGGGQPLPASGYRFSTRYGTLEYKMNTLGTAEEAVARTFIANLNALEAAVVAAGSNLDTESAAVWVRNPNEVRDRTRLYNQQRRELCRFLGIPPGPELGEGGLTVVV